MKGRFIMMSYTNSNISEITNKLYSVTAEGSDTEKEIYPLDDNYFISCHVIHGRSGNSAGLTLETKESPVYGCVISANSKGDRFNFDTSVLRMIQTYHNMKRSAELNAVFC